MSKRAKIICAACLLVLAGGLSVLHWWPQPTYQGKPMRWWLRQAPTQWDLDGHVAQCEALRSFGAVALPNLLSAVEGRTGWRDQVERIDAWLYQASNQKWPRLTQPAREPDLKRQFQFLGELADPAVPELLQLARSADDECASQAAMALFAMDSTNAMNALASLLASTNAAQRALGACGLASFGPRASHLTPTLVRQASEPDLLVSRPALYALASVTSDAATLIPILTNALASGDPWIRQFAPQALRPYGSTAVAAAPAISNLLQSVGLANAQGWRLPATLNRLQSEMRDGAILRGPRDRKQIALLFTGHDYGEGGEAILAALTRHQAKGSFFLTGSFLTNTAFPRLVERILRGGHYHSIHSDQHLLYCSWDRPPKTLVSRWEFEMDVKRNHAKIALERRTTSFVESQDRRYTFENPEYSPIFFVPPYEHWNREIAHWARRLGYELVSYTPGTRANADYTEDGAPNFVSSQAIFDSILAREREDPNGLNGFLLLLHLGAGPKRTDKFHTRFDELLTVLSAKGYQFVRVDELLNGPVSAPGD